MSTNPLWQREIGIRHEDDGGYHVVWHLPGTEAPFVWPQMRCNSYEEARQLADRLHEVFERGDARPEDALGVLDALGIERGKNP